MLLDMNSFCAQQGGWGVWGAPKWKPFPGTLTPSPARINPRFGLSADTLVVPQTPCKGCGVFLPKEPRFRQHLCFRSPRETWLFFTHGDQVVSFGLPLLFPIALKGQDWKANSSSVPKALHDKGVFAQGCAQTRGSNIHIHSGIQGTSQPRHQQNLEQVSCFELFGSEPLSANLSQ